MSTDIKKLAEQDKAKEMPLKKGHEARFLAKLDTALPEQKKPNYFKYLSIAASIVVLIGLGFYVFNKKGEITTTVVANPTKVTEHNQLSLGDLSPDLKKVEDYYETTINFELSKLELNTSNKVLVDSYIDQLAELNTEYTALNNELNTDGPNDQIINALIENLQLRLKLLQKLKQKLIELKSSKNEQTL